MKTAEINKIAEVKLIYKTKVKASDRTQIKCSTDAFNLFKESWDPDSLEYVEEFKILLLNRSNSVLGIFPLSKGGISGTVTDLRVLFQAAIKANASGIVAAHNHPSGNINPSESDLKLTRKIKEAGTILDIQFLDHIIITAGGGFYSFADNGQL